MRGRVNGGGTKAGLRPGGRGLGEGIGREGVCVCGRGGVSLINMPEMFSPLVYLEHVVCWTERRRALLPAGPQPKAPRLPVNTPHHATPRHTTLHHTTPCYAVLRTEQVCPSHTAGLHVQEGGPEFFHFLRHSDPRINIQKHPVSGCSAETSDVQQPGDSRTQTG